MVQASSTRLGAYWLLTARHQRAEFVQCHATKPACSDPTLRAVQQSAAIVDLRCSPDFSSIYLSTTAQGAGDGFFFSALCCFDRDFARQQHKAEPRRAHAPRPIQRHHRARPSNDPPLVNPHPHPDPLETTSTSASVSCIIIRPIEHSPGCPFPPRPDPTGPDPDPSYPSSLLGPPSPMLCLDHHGSAS